MATLQEIYQKAVERHGANSRSAKALKLQIDSEALTKGLSAERFFVASFQPSKHYSPETALSKATQETKK